MRIIDYKYFYWLFASFYHLCICVISVPFMTLKIYRRTFNEMSYSDSDVFYCFLQKNEIVALLNMIQLTVDLL